MGQERLGDIFYGKEKEEIIDATPQTIVKKWEVRCCKAVDI